MGRYIMNSVGTLNEKSIHSFIKEYIEPDKSKHEIRVNGYIADIKDGTHIFEIQTKDFGRLKSKLDAYNNDYVTTIVYPISIVRYLNWVDPVTHEILERRKTPSRASIQDIFIELYKIREYLMNNKLEFKVIALESEEYKYLDGYGPSCKNKATKIDKIPTKVLQEINFSVNGGYEQFIPTTLQYNFTANDFAKHAHCSLKTARVTLLILTELNYVARIGRKDRKYVYQVNNDKLNIIQSKF